ncbi:MAG: hypothetical protein LBM93_10780 [Oscillospiraceae bacterium]|jgi:hypothetical protein|nr:hypothetical protein [Oscillospiraceae bacterium]
MNKQLMINALQKAIRECGIEVINNPKRLRAILGDFLPGKSNKFNRKFILDPLELDDWKLLLEVHNKGKSEHQRAVNVLSKQLQNYLRFSESDSLLILECFIVAMGWNDVSFDVSDNFLTISKVSVDNYSINEIIEIVMKIIDSDVPLCNYQGDKEKDMQRVLELFKNGNEDKVQNNFQNRCSDKYDEIQPWTNEELLLYKQILNLLINLSMSLYPRGLNALGTMFFNAQIFEYNSYIAFRLCFKSYLFGFEKAFYNVLKILHISKETEEEFFCYEYIKYGFNDRKYNNFSFCFLMFINLYCNDDISVDLNHLKELLICLRKRINIDNIDIDNELKKIFNNGQYYCEYFESYDEIENFLHKALFNPDKLVEEIEESWLEVYENLESIIEYEQIMEEKNKMIEMVDAFLIEENNGYYYNTDEACSLAEKVIVKNTDKLNDVAKKTIYDIAFEIQNKEIDIEEFRNL